MRRSHARRLVAVALVGTVGLVACGGDDDTDRAASTPADTAPATEYVDEEYVDEDDVPSTDATVAATTANTVPATGATDPPSTDAPADASTLTISEFVFSSPSVTAGAPFTLTNDDSFAHTVTSRDGFFDVGLDGGASDTLTLAAPGTYEIFCRIHPSMEGTITVV